MSIELNHTIVYVKNKNESALFLSEVLGLSAPVSFGPFQVVKTNNGVSLDFMNGHGEITPQHYAFLVSEEEFDQIFARIKDRHIRFWADQMGSQEGEINHRDGGRGCYFEDPSGHYLEILTRPYGSGRS